jgi:hypothetical protein
MVALPAGAEVKETFRMPQSVINVLVVAGLVILIGLLAFARRWMRSALYDKMNQPGKQKSAIQKWLGW